MTASLILPKQLGLPATNTLGPGDTIKPFLRWTGSKRRLVDQIRPFLPSTFDRYHEPFMGSAALFFALRPRVAYLSDLNTRLCRTYTATQSELPALVTTLKIYAKAYADHGGPFYDHARKFDPDEMNDVECAAWFIFMNKTNFNGLYRVNKNGVYNVPHGKFASPPTICDEVALDQCSKVLKNAIVINTDFFTVEERAQQGDLVYFDPPYVPTGDTADFTTYTAGGFSQEQHVELRNLAARLKKKGCYVVLSNSDAPLVRELYAGWEINEISRSGSVSSDVEGRQKVVELLIR